MGKRSNFARRPQDCYDTPPQAVAPLLPHLPEKFVYWEPCAGRGALVDALHGVAVNRTDINPRRDDILLIDALQMRPRSMQISIWDYIITNPPWTRQILHPMIEHFSDMRPTWLLFDADWMHTKQAAPYLWRLRRIVSVGRVKWIPDSPHTGKDNCCWYLFDAHGEGPSEFVGRE